MIILYTFCLVKENKDFFSKWFIKKRFTWTAIQKHWSAQRICSISSVFVSNTWISPSCPHVRKWLKQILIYLWIIVNKTNLPSLV